MRLNKKKLAAVILSAVMAASMVPTTAFAEDEVVVPEVQATEERSTLTDATPTPTEQPKVTEIPTPEVSYKLDEDSITFSADGTVAYELDYNDGTVKQMTTTATRVQEKAADCENAASYKLQAEIGGKTFTSEETFTEGKANGHKSQTKDVVVTPATCTEDGVGQTETTCSVCGKELADPVTYTIDATGHTYGDSKVRYEAVDNIKVYDEGEHEGEPVLGKDGLPQLDDDSYLGIYNIVTYKTCTVCGAEEVISTVPDAITPTNAKQGWNCITDTENIADEIMYMTKDEVEETYGEDGSGLELENCTKDASYTVSYYSSAGKVLYTKKITVEKHHLVKQLIAEFKTESDKDLCTVTYDEETKTLTVKNNTCNKEITYNEIEVCSAEGCPLEEEIEGGKVVSRTAKVAEPAGNHVVNADVRANIKSIINANKNSDGLLTAEGYTELEEYVKSDEAKNYAKLASTAVCETSGTVTITYVCRVCGKDTTVTDSVKVVALGHVMDDPVQENVVEPTCTSLGSCDSVVYCSRCGEELLRTKGVKIPRLKHTNETAVLSNGVGIDSDDDTKAYISFEGTRVVDNDGSLQDNIGDSATFWEDGSADSVYWYVDARVVTNCDVCEKNIVILTYVDSTILSVKPENKVGGVGSITFEASYRKTDGETITEQITLPYFSTYDAYLNYQGVIKPTVDGLYKDDDGVYRYYVDGKVDTSFSGIVEYEGGEFFVAKGVLCSDANGMQQNVADGKWYFLSQGQIQRGHNGLAEYDGAWFYLTDGEINTTINGLVSYDGGQFVFAEGQLQSQANGLWEDSDGKWYFLSQGQVQTQFTGVAMYDGAFFVVRAGIFANDYNGTIEYDGATFNVVNGQLYDKVA